MADDVKKSVIKKDVAHPLRVETGTLRSGKKLRIGIAGSKEPLLEVAVPKGKTFEYTATIAIREKDTPEE